MLNVAGARTRDPKVGEEIGGMKERERNVITISVNFTAVEKEGGKNDYVFPNVRH